MTRLHNDPDDFVDEMINGFAAVNSAWVRRVRGGVVRSTKVEDGQVAVVVGGGSGHYPTFSGFVGPGLAHGAAMGNLFASPSSQQIASVARNAEHGGGVVFSYGNYAGDVLHFGHAQEELNAAGIPTRTVVVTDDVYSAPVAEKRKRRGIAGDFTVFKIAGAAAAEGHNLDEVVRLADKANENTRSIGVAFSGCSLPGASTPLFDVPEGRMEVGMGIHGEPGIDEVDVPTADGLAEMLVDAVLRAEEWPEGHTRLEGARIAVLLNGLGSVKYEELFVVYRRIDQLLRERGVVVVEPECGELVTSFDMAGVSLTVFWLDDELERLWSAPASAPGYRKGSVLPAEPVSLDDIRAAVTEVDIVEGSQESRQLAAELVDVLGQVRNTIRTNADELGRIDAVAGDGDHGIGMDRGVGAAHTAAIDALANGAGAGEVLRRAADAWSDRAGGTSGALWGSALTIIGEVIGDEHIPDRNVAAEAIDGATEAILRFGATPGDKTMLDALVPFRDEFLDRVRLGDTAIAAWNHATGIARESADATAELVPKIGRARPHALKSVGTPDAGAISFALIVETINSAWAASAASAERKNA